MSAPGRSLIGAEPLTPFQPYQTRVLLTCDCGTAADLTVEVEGELRGGKGEAAVTCDGCRTVFWFTVTATTGKDSSEEGTRDEH